MKRCTKCGEALPLANFNKRAASSDGMQPCCRECQRQADTARRRAQGVRSRADGRDDWLKAVRRGNLKTRKFDHDEACRRYQDGATAMAVASSFGVTEDAVLQALRKAGVPRREPRGVHHGWYGLRGEACPHWQEHPSYGAVHDRKRARDGSARHQRCADCGGPAQEYSFAWDRDPHPVYWETVKGFLLPYTTDLDAMVPRCSSCHRLFDAEMPRAQ